MGLNISGIVGKAVNRSKSLINLASSGSGNGNSNNYGSNTNRTTTSNNSNPATYNSNGSLATYKNDNNTTSVFDTWGRNVGTINNNKKNN